MVDPAKALTIINSTSGRRDDNIVTGIVQDVFLTLTLNKHLNLNAGQFKVPLSLEGLESSAALDTERALFISDRARGGAYGDIRNIVMAFGPLTSGSIIRSAFSTGAATRRMTVPTTTRRLLRLG